ncbi:hypothetical protein RFI_37734, partial [Reticulomyxa filosa]
CCCCCCCYHYDYRTQCKEVMERILNWFNPSRRAHNLAYFFIVLFVLCLLGGSAVYANHGEPSSLSRITYALGGLVIVVHSFAILFFLPQFQDLWHLRDEIRWMAIIIITTFIIGLLLLLPLSQHDPPSSSYAIIFAWLLLFFYTNKKKRGGGIGHKLKKTEGLL